MGISAALKAMKIAADSCIYTNHNFTMEKIEASTRKLDSPSQDSQGASISSNSPASNGDEKDKC
jgi:hypothetical protein